MESDYSNEKVKIERLFFYNGRSFMKKLELFRDFEELNLIEYIRYVEESQSFGR